MRSFVMAGHRKSTTRAGGSFFEDQSDVFIGQPFGINAGTLEIFQIAGEVQQIPDLKRRIVLQGKKAATLQICRHDSSPLLFQLSFNDLLEVRPGDLLQ